MKKKETVESIEKKLKKIIKGQYVENILKWDIKKLATEALSFSYYLDQEEFERLEKEVLGRKILVTNRHKWSSEDIILAYRQQSNVENVFRTIKNPFHLAVRPQYHWLDHNITVHFFICVIGYLLAACNYSIMKKNMNYPHSISKMLDDLKKIRLACIIDKNKKVNYQFEEMDNSLINICKCLGISEEKPKVNINISNYNF